MENKKGEVRKKVRMEKKKAWWKLKRVDGKEKGLMEKKKV